MINKISSAMYHTIITSTNYFINEGKKKSIYLERIVKHSVQLNKEMMQYGGVISVMLFKNDASQVIDRKRANKKREEIGKTNYFI